MKESGLTHIPFSESSHIDGHEIKAVQVDWDEVIVSMEDGTIRTYPRQCSKCGYFEPVKEEDK